MIAGPAYAFWSPRRSKLSAGLIAITLKLYDLVCRVFSTFQRPSVLNTRGNEESSGSMIDGGAHIFRGEGAADEP
jgi:hypothetical protein